MATMMGIKKAKTKELRAVPADSLGVAPTPVVLLDSLALPSRQKTTQILSGTPAEAAAALVEKLQQEVRVL